MTEKRELTDSGALVDRVAILVPSCDHYGDLWAPFFQCFFKYWPDCPFQMYLGSNFVTHSHTKVTSLMVGQDVDYSSNLAQMIKRIKQEWLIVWLDDRLLRARVVESRIIKLVEFASSQNIGYLKLAANHPFALDYDESTKYGDIPKGAKYRVGFTIALWRKSTLQAIIQNGESAWQLERNGSLRSAALQERFLALSIRDRLNPPLCDEHLIAKGRLIRACKPFLVSEALSHMLAGRKEQSWIGHLYTKIYYAAHDLLGILPSALVHDRYYRLSKRMVT
jgi:hypothetical protein